MSTPENQTNTTQSSAAATPVDAIAASKIDAVKAQVLAHLPAKIQWNGVTGVWATYAAFALGLIFPLGMVLGALLAAITPHKEEDGELVRSHRQWQITTFVRSLLGAVVGVLLGASGAFFEEASAIVIAGFSLIGLLILCVAYLWTVYRVIKGGICFYHGKLAVTTKETGDNFVGKVKEILSKLKKK